MMSSLRIWVLVLFVMGALGVSSGCDGDPANPPAGGTGGAGGAGGMGGTADAGGMGGEGGEGGGACVPIDDQNDCTEDVCNADGTTAHNPKAAGEPCANGVGHLCSSIGLCVECLGPQDCPGTDDACQQRACAGGACDMVFTAANTPLPIQNLGDCKVVVCDGNGSTTTNDDNADVPDDGSACTADACIMGMPSSTNLPAGTTCTPPGGMQPLFCDSMGQCTGCVAPADCPGADDECSTRTCTAGICGVSFTAAETPVAAQMPNDCLLHVCDGAGHFVQIADDTDTPLDDGFTCTGESCAAGLPLHTNVPDGTDCSDKDACTTPDMCIGGVCKSGTPVVCAPPALCQNAGVCDPAQGTCTYETQADGTDCDDGDVCTSTDHCVAGACSGTPMPDGSACALNGSQGVCQSGQCQLCGNGEVDPPEECDDKNAVSGDGCDACTIELTCAVGETRLVLLNDTPLAIPDAGATVLSPVNVAITGGVTKAIAVVHSLKHDQVGDIGIYLVSPQPLQRALSADNGSSGNDYTYTTFDDDADELVSNITAPFTGRYRPEQSLTVLGAGFDFKRLNALGSWSLALVDDQAQVAGTLNAWSLALCVKPTSYCGDGLLNDDEECDDGNTNNADTCNNLCQHTDGCGDGNFDLGEECDDNNVIAGDGCSPTCHVEITCAAGQTPLVVTNAMSAGVPDDNTFHEFPVDVSISGGVEKVVAVLGSVAHTNVQELDLRLRSPLGTSRTLSSNNGGSGDDYTSTFFEDAALSPITSAAAPFNGHFKPEETLSTAKGTDLYRQNALGTWSLQIRDTQAVNFAVFHTWTLALCLGTTNYCGNGTIEAGEECDDGNTNNGDLCSNTCTVQAGCGDAMLDAGEECDDGNVASGDGCSSSCDVEIACAAGQTPVILTNSTATTIKGGNWKTSFPMNVGTQGAIKKAVVVIGHAYTQLAKNLSLDLVSSVGTKRHLSSNNGGYQPGYVSTIFNDSAATPITSGTSPLNGTYKPEQSLSTTAGTDFRDENPAGAWTLQAVLEGFTDGTLESWSLGLCLDTTTYCGNGTLDPGEQCDDGNRNNADACSNACKYLSCGDGDYDAGEQCDDGNTVAGDGCSSTCTLELGCAAGQTPVVVTNTTPTVIPSGGSFVDVPVNVATVGSVKKVVPIFGYVSALNVVDVEAKLQSPFGTTRRLTMSNGGSGAHFKSTRFDDKAAISIVAGVAPFTGNFRAEDSLSALRTKDFLDEGAVGTWNLQMKKSSGWGNATVFSFSLGLCVDTTTYCGNGALNADEECDDGNTTSGDGCSNVCTREDGCGDGNIDANEQCDDNGLVSGDGCSSTCQVEITCAPGQTLVVVTDTSVSTIPDTYTDYFGINVPVAGAVKKVVVSLGKVTHPDTGQLSFYLRSPLLTSRLLSGTNGGSGDDYIATLFDEQAATPINVGAAPFTGKYKPTQSLAQMVGTDFLNQNALGTWALGATDKTRGQPEGTLERWSLALCLETSVFCGNGIREGNEDCDDGNASDADGCSRACVVTDGCGDGNIDAGEQCDDDNTIVGDGCSSTCQVEIACGAGETPVIVTNSTAAAIPDNNTYASFPVSVAQQGGVRKVIALVNGITHPNVGDLDIQLRGPDGTVRVLSDDNGGMGDNYVSTVFNDAASISVVNTQPPFTRGVQPEQSLSTSVAADFLAKKAMGTWALEVRDDTSFNTGTFNKWTLALCVAPADYCGNGIMEPGEECDDGNGIDNDLCTNKCQLADGCGDGNVDMGEVCDDDNFVSGDGCSSTCEVELDCAPGQTKVVASSYAQMAIPDNVSTYTDSPVSVATGGAVKKVLAVIGGITHGNLADLALVVQSPIGTTRVLDDISSGTHANYRSTIFDDTAVKTTSGGKAPFNGWYKPLWSLSEAAGTDFLNQNAIGTWNLKVRDLALGYVGTLDSWSLLLCLDTTVYCGNSTVEAGEECDDGNSINGDACSNVCLRNDGCGDGNIDPGERCDDNNIKAGDGCSPSCQIEINCGAGETPVFVSYDTPSAIPDNNTFTDFPVTVAAAGGVKKVIVAITSLTHTADNDLDIQLLGPTGLARNLSDDNGSVDDNYMSTIFDDAVVGNSIVYGSAPLSGVYKPEASLSSDPAADFLLKKATGTWTLQVRDDTPTNTGTLNSWTLALCVDATHYCGDGVANADEECDDGNAVNNDACTNSCQITNGCGDGNIDAGEQCDDNNRKGGDGCSTTCQFDIACAAGEIPVVVTNATATAIPDNATMMSTINIAQTGVVRKVSALISVTHPSNANLDIWLDSPYGVQRALVMDRDGVNYTATIFTDDAAVPISSGASPFTGRFKPQYTLSNAAGFANQTAAGNWRLHIDDDTTGSTGTLNAWSLALCIDPSVTEVCSNGYVEPGETCDDGNTTSGDGCSATCQLEFSCPPGQLAIIQKSTDGPVLVPDYGSGQSVINLGEWLKVSKVGVVLNSITHAHDLELTIKLISPAATVFEMSGNNGAGADYVSTIFDAAAPTAVSAGSSPFRGVYQPFASLSGVYTQSLRGTWTLKVEDDADDYSGILKSWTLALCGY